jgi:hypothetical protein
MKSKSTPQKLPASVTRDEVQERLPKNEAILLRLSERDKASITEAAKSVHLTATEYLVKCHELVVAKLEKR